MLIRIVGTSGRKSEGGINIRFLLWRFRGVDCCPTAVTEVRLRLQRRVAGRAKHHGACGIHLFAALVTEGAVVWDLRFTVNAIWHDETYFPVEASRSNTASDFTAVRER